MSAGTEWRFLIIEDQELAVRQLLESLPSFVEGPDTAEGEVVGNFSQAAARLKQSSFDVLILDLKDDSDTDVDAESDPAGLKIFEELKKTRFVPVVFYTALAHKVRAFETSFVRVVEKTEGIGKVKQEVRRVMTTQLPSLTRTIEDLQRSYMWDFVSTHWKEFDAPHEKADLAYVLARRLALSLQNEAGKFAQKLAGENIPVADEKNIHPMEMYVHPVVSSNRLAGDILKRTVNGKMELWMVMTPSCDFEQKGRLNNVLLAQCVPLSDQAEFEKWKSGPEQHQEALKALIGDNRQKSQPERFKFLPGTFFLPDSLVDFQQLQAIPYDEVEKMEVIASLDSPFAEAALARFARYFGRLGTPNIDRAVVIDRLKAQIAASTSGKDRQQPK